MFFFRYNKVERLWVMRHAGNNDFLATSRASESSLLLGTHLWVVFNDSLKCSIDGMFSYMTNLTLHACTPQQFACDNAFCIAMTERCDAKEDCSDGSDELNCGKLMVRPGYKKELTPIQENGQNVVVKFFINILDIEISESTETFSSRISWTREWFDGRLQYKNLKNETGTKMNTILTGESVSNTVWYPRFSLHNIRSIEDFKKLDHRDLLVVIPNDKFTFLTEDNMHIFEGSMNALSLEKEKNVKWKCDYAYDWYPFDTQVCRMEFVSSVSHIDVLPSNLQYNRNISLSRYTLSKIRMCKSFINNKKAMIIEVTLNRPIVNFLLTVFVPTILLVIISFTARFFAEDYIDMVIQVNLTIQLVLGTM